MLEAVTLKEIEKVFSVTDAMGIHREAVVIPLEPGSPGRVRKLSNEKIEIIVDAHVPIDDWLKSLPDLIRQATGS